MTDEPTSQTSAEPAQKTDEEIAADTAAAVTAASAASASPDSPVPAKDDLDLDVPPTTSEGETEANEDTAAAPEVGSTHHGRHGILAGPEHTQHSQHSGHHKTH